MKKNYSEKIVGYVEKQGEFNGNAYHNYYLVTILHENGIPVSCDCKNYKFKVADVVDVLGTDDISNVIGSSIVKAYFDKFGRLAGVDYE